VSSYNLDTIYKIDRASGDVLWRLGGESSDFQLADPDERFFRRQHQFDVLDGGIVIFDNGEVTDYESRAVEFGLDWASGDAEEVWSHVADPPLYVLNLGDAHRISDDSYLVTWGSAGQIDEVTFDGDVTWSLNSELGGAFGYTTWRESLYVSE